MPCLCGAGAPVGPGTITSSNGVGAVLLPSTVPSSRVSPPAAMRRVPAAGLRMTCRTTTGSTTLRAVSDQPCDSRAYLEWNTETCEAHNAAQLIRVQEPFDLIGLFSRGLLWRGTARKVRNGQTCDADRSGALCAQVSRCLWCRCWVNGEGVGDDTPAAARPAAADLRDSRN